MRSPDRTDVERIESLLRGVPPESEREARLEGLFRELRAAAPAAPPATRERVRALRPRERQPFAWRPALVALAIAGVVVGGVALLPRGDGGGQDAAEAELTFGPTTTVRDSGKWGALEEVRGDRAPLQQPSFVPVPSAAASEGRAQEWDVSLELRVRDNDRLSDASADAIRTTRELGGFVVSSSVATQGQNGEARLVLRVPSRRIQDAITRLSELGTITGQQVSIQDRQDDLDRLARRIDSLRVQIAELNLRLRTETLAEPQRLRLELRRQRLTGLVNSLTSQRRGVSREVSLAEVSLIVRTGQSAAAPAEGRIEAAARDALHVLAVAGAVAIFLLIVLAPLLAVALLLWLGRRSLRRRADERLLDRPQPAPARE